MLTSSSLYVVVRYIAMIAKLKHLSPGKFDEIPSVNEV